MKVNRYSNVSTAKYNPMSLDEIMMVPLLKRKQHDDLLNDVAVTREGLATVDPLDIHAEQAAAEQQKLESMLQQQVDEASTNGISNTLRGDFMNLNAKYQQTMSPTGTLGKINAANAALKAERDAFIANDTAQGFSSEDAARNWQKHQEQYEQNFAQTGKISNIDPLYAPKYVDYVKEFQDIALKAGLRSYDSETAKSYLVFDDKTGSYVVTDEGRRANASNDTNLQHLADWMTSRLYNKDSDLYKSIEHEGKDPESVKNELLGMQGIFNKNETKTADKSTISSYNAPDISNSVTDGGMGITASAEQYSPVKYDNMDQYQLMSKIEDLQAMDPAQMTAAEKRELQEMTQFKVAVDKELATNPDYVEATRELTDAQAKYEAIQNQTYNYGEDPMYKGIAEGGFIDEGEGIAKARALVEEQARKAVDAAKRKISDISKKDIEGVKLKMTSYQMTPYTPKQASILKIANENLDRLLRDNPQALEQMTNINEVMIDGKPVAVTSSRDQLGISKLFYNAPEGHIEIVNVTPQGFDGLPQYTLRIKPYKDMPNYDMDGPVAPWTNDNVGKDEAVQVRVSMKDITTGAANNINGLVQDYIAATGPQGQQLVESMRMSSAFDKFYGKTWGEIENSVQISPNSALFRIKAEKLRQLGITSASTDEEISAAEQKLAGTKLTRDE